MSPFLFRVINNLLYERKLKGGLKMFKNKKIEGGTYATRYIASWIREGGELRYGEDIDDFREWLLSEELSENDANDVIFLATNGKMELEFSAAKFLKNKTKLEK